MPPLHRGGPHHAFPVSESNGCLHRLQVLGDGDRLPGEHGLENLREEGTGCGLLRFNEQGWDQDQDSQVQI